MHADAKLLRSLGKGEHRLINFWCPGCKCAHSVSPVRWKVTGEGTNTPTFEPSVLVYPHKIIRDDFTDIELAEAMARTPDGQELPAKFVTMSPRCHLFVRNGMIEFLGDCEHALAGKTVPMEPF